MNEHKDHFWPSVVPTPDQPRITLLGPADKPSSVPRESIGVSPATSIICQAALSSSTPELVHLLTIHRQAIWSSFPGGQQTCDASHYVVVYGHYDKRLSKTLAWHHFNYSQVQCRVVPAKATAHLAVLQCCSGRRKF